MSYSQPVVLTAAFGVVLGCARKAECNGGDTADVDRLKVVIDHVEEDGEYSYTYESGRVQGVNTCTLTAPLGDASPSCLLQGGAVVVKTDGAGIASIDSATSDYGDRSLVVTRDGVEVFSSSLEPTWTPAGGAEGCHVYDQGLVEVAF